MGLLLSGSNIMKSPFISRVISTFILLVVRLMHCSYRYRFHGVEHVLAAQQQYGGYIYSCWHRNVIASTLSQGARRYVVMISKSRSANPIDVVCRSFGHTVVRGSSAKAGRDKGGAFAKAEMIAALKSGLSGAVTADGPTGPPQQAKQGIIDMAGDTGYGIVPFAGIPRCAWELKTWDRMLLPKPFTRIDVYYGAALQVPAQRDKATRDDFLMQLNAATNNLER